MWIESVEATVSHGVLLTWAKTLLEGLAGVVNQPSRTPVEHTVMQQDRSWGPFRCRQFDLTQCWRQRRCCAGRFEFLRQWAPVTVLSREKVGLQHSSTAGGEELKSQSVRRQEERRKACWPGLGRERLWGD